MKDSILGRIKAYLGTNPKQSDKDYYVPSLWLGDFGTPKNCKENYNNFYNNVLSSILNQAKESINYSQSLSSIKNTKTGIGGDWSYTSSIYNAFPRLATAYDHDNDGNVGAPTGNVTLDANQLFRETGTFLKLIAILPFIKSLGCNVIHCMPITSIGEDGNRGDLGSPYAIKNQYKIDPNLADPLLPFTVEEQLSAFVEAAHILEIRVVLEFVLRTNSLGGDWVKEHPEWFYWIDKNVAKNYTSPAFPQHELDIIKEIPKGGGFHFAPSMEYRNQFKKPPLSSQIKEIDGKFIAETAEGELVIPGAFADWPPDDIQPAWSDVTYLRMYNYDYDDITNNYNYMAYNTIRFYDPQLAEDKNINRPLWDKLAGVIPYYQENFGIDGVMMDMGHALPKKLMGEIITKAREIDHDFAFLEENFEIEWSSRDAGFNGTLGFEWRTSGAKKGGIKDVIEKALENLPLPFFGSPETHNTPRSIQRGGMLHSQQMWVINNFLPNCMPFVHNGYELCEDYPINTGLNFTQEELNHYEGHRLGLFYKNAFDWNRETNLVNFMKKVNQLRQNNFEMIANGDERSLIVHYPENNYGHVLAFERFDMYNPWKSILVIVNTNYESYENFYLKIHGTFDNSYKDHLTDNSYNFVAHWLSADLAPGQCLLFEMDKFLG